MNREQVEHHWRYFLNLEKNLDSITNYIEPNESNFNSYSMELNKIIFLAASEFEVVSKELCNVIDTDNDPSRYKINQIREKLLEEYPYIHNTEIRLTKMDFKYKPLSEWSNGETPQWWKDYNSLKHDRFSNYSLSNFKNALFAIGSLMIINMYLNQKIVNWINVNVDRLPSFLDATYLPEGVLAKGPENLPDYI